MRRITLKSMIFCIIAALSAGLLAGCTESSKFSKNDISQHNGKSITENDKDSNDSDLKPGTDESTGQGNPADENRSNGTNGFVHSGEDTGTGNNKGAENGTGGTNNQEPAETENKRIKVKGMYLTGWTVGNMSNVERYIELAKTTELNAYVIDVKDDDGYVGYESGIPAVREIGAWKNKYDVDKVLKAFHDNGVHIIGRVVCFKDPVLSSKRADLAVKNVNGGLWRDNWELTWLNPYNKNSWPYLIDVVREAVSKGFDEIQFDYIRFPNDGNKKAMDFGTTELKKDEAINEFIAYARKELPGVVLSADVFGIICESPADTEDIGQNLELIGKDIEYISPMVYPSHYATGQIVNEVRFAKPDLDPYGVVYNSLVKAKNRISSVEGYKADVRPFLQYFTASWLNKGYYQKYGIEQVRQQIKAVYDAGYEEWILWDANNFYTEASLLKGN